MREQGVGRAPLGTGVFACKRQIIIPAPAREAIGLAQAQIAPQGARSLPAHRSEVFCDLSYPSESLDLGAQNGPPGSKIIAKYTHTTVRNACL